MSRSRRDRRRGFQYLPPGAPGEIQNPSSPASWTTMIGKRWPVRARVFSWICAKRSSSPATSPPRSECFDILSPPPGDSDVISQIDRLSSNETKIAPRSVRIAVGVWGWSATICMVASRVRVSNLIVAGQANYFGRAGGDRPPGERQRRACELSNLRSFAQSHAWRSRIVAGICHGEAARVPGWIGPRRFIRRLLDAGWRLRPPFLSFGAPCGQGKNKGPSIGVEGPLRAVVCSAWSGSGTA